MAFMDAFSKIGPNRPPAVEDVFDPDFEMIWGEEPTGPSDGGRWGMKHKRAIVQWQQARRRFKALTDVDLPDETEELVMAESGAVAIPWESNTGRVYLAILGGAKTLTNFPLRIFQRLPAGTVSTIVVNNIIHRGGFVDPLPERHRRALGENNNKNRPVEAEVVR